MRPNGPPHARLSIVLGLTLIGPGSALSCTGDGEAGPSAPISDAASLQPAGKAIVVGNAAELVGALSPENAGRRISGQRSRACWRDGMRCWSGRCATWRTG
jgi:hypothetical protein